MTSHFCIIEINVYFLSCGFTFREAAKKEKKMEILFFLLLISRSYQNIIQGPELFLTLLLVEVHFTGDMSVQSTYLVIMYR